ncbi:GNAT family N-acetyltransferase [Tenacibaculum piscium]|uniref:GNAT family N-acetyltransferase n=1 Tax=Tenacibaculum piscium TaxID=1458515 RepID=UPI00187BB493|nr:GNAT family N-acetyltransferase [Tenacibaculum piscium]MBE7685158.1 GNAT family N-acetyltransferase [Tenacibaculum piscium]
MNFPTIFPELSTERATLRQVSFKDKRAIFKLRSNKEINKLISRETPKNLNDADAFIENCLTDFENETRIFWVIEHQDSSKVIGSIVLSNFNSENDYAEISYELSPDYQKEGLMREAIQSVLAFGNVDLALKTIEAFTHNNNNDAIALLEKQQFILQSSSQANSQTANQVNLENTHIFRLDIIQA